MSFYNTPLGKITGKMVHDIVGPMGGAKGNINLIEKWIESGEIEITKGKEQLLERLASLRERLERADKALDVGYEELKQLQQN